MINLHVSYSMTKDEKVKHPAKPEWGIGRILEEIGDEKYRIFFANAGEKVINTSFANLVMVKGEEACHPLLDCLITDYKGRIHKYKSLDLLKDIFISEFPDGFYSDDYLKNERNYKVEAHNSMSELLNKNLFLKLLSEKNYTEISKRALNIVNKTNLLFPNEKMALKDGVKQVEHHEPFGDRLFNLLYGEQTLEGRFNDFAETLFAMDAAKWTTITYFLFIAFPEKYMFMKPSVTQDAAEVCAFELNYRPEINWLTYKCLLDFSRYLFGELSDLKPRDMIDVQSFIWSVARIAEGEYKKS